MKKIKDFLEGSKVVMTELNIRGKEKLEKIQEYISAFSTELKQVRKDHKELENEIRDLENVIGSRARNEQMG